jgi:hypothetical protein
MTELSEADFTLLRLQHKGLSYRYRQHGEITAIEVLGPERRYCLTCSAIGTELDIHTEVMRTISDSAEVGLWG